MQPRGGEPPRDKILLIMEIKILQQAVAYAPEKVVEFIINLYLEADPDHKADIEAKFAKTFTNGGSLLPDDSNAK